MASRFRLVLGLLIAAAIAVALTAPQWLRSERGQDEAPPRERASAPTPVEVFRVVPGPFSETLITPGSLAANERIDVVSEIAGTVTEISFSEGSRVEANDLLLKIDDRELIAGRDRVKTRLELAQRRSARQYELHGQGLISDDALETAQTEADALRADLAQIEVRLDKTEIRAPFAGIVGLRRVSEGAYLSPQTRITTLVDSDPVKLEFAVPERYSERFGPGDRVTFQVEGEDTTRQATIYAAEPTVDPETRTVPMRARSPNPDGRLIPGGFADVTLAVRQVENALAVPNIAVIPELGGKKVFVVEADAAQPRQVETGIRTGDRVQITTGLVAGDRVIVTGLQFLRPGLAVEITAETEDWAGTAP